MGGGVAGDGGTVVRCSEMKYVFKGYFISQGICT